MPQDSRRRFLRTGLIGGGLVGYGALVGPSVLAAARPTPPEIEGPFYPVTPQKDKDFDLTRVDGQTGVAKGRVVWIEGEVVDTADKPVEDATVDLWQANAAGRYRHPHDPNSAPLDPNFQGWAVVQSGTKGRFRFKTIIPGSYPASRTWMRPPHIHFKVSKRGYVELVTQMYFPDQKLNGSDRLLTRKTAAEQKLMIASRTKDATETYRYQIVLEEV